MPEHDKRVALVTGANRGIGYAISRRLGEQNITGVLGARDPHKGTEACSRLQGEGLDAHFELLDVIDEKSIKKAIENIRTHFGRLDILVNNAGIMIDGQEDVRNVNPETIQKTIQTNVMGPLMLCQCCIPLMQAGDYGRIVNMASTRTIFSVANTISMDIILITKIVDSGFQKGGSHGKTLSTCYGIGNAYFCSRPHGGHHMCCRRKEYEGLGAG